MTIVTVDQSSWGKLRVTGEDRERFMQGMVTNELAGMAVGTFRKAAILSVKGRVLAVVDIVAEEGSYLVLTEPATGKKVLDVLERHAIADDVTFTPVELPCHRVWDSLEAVWIAPPVLVAAAAPSSDAEVEIRRVEAGLPRYGADVSEDQFPFEANLDRIISYTKGCYAGQEVVARANARGHAAGAKIVAATRPDAGWVTSAVVSPAFGPIALAYVHHTVWAPGTALQAGEIAATVTELPFGAG
jgi:folate-binding protein YgfZ